MIYIKEYNKFEYKYRPTILFIDPSESKITHDYSISVEGFIKWVEDSDVYLKLNDKWVPKSYYKVKNGKLFAPDIRLEEGDNKIKIIAKNNAGTKDYSRIITYEKLPELVYTNVENYKVMDVIEKIIMEYFSNIDPFNKEKENKVFNIEGKVINTEFLSKWKNNRTFRKEITKQFNLGTSPSDLIKFLIENKYDIFNINGKYFDRYYKIMEYTTMKGKNTEEKSIKIFADFLSSIEKIKKIEIKEPTTDEDKKGIDSFFILDGKKITVQVKPLEKVNYIKPDYIELVSAGDVRKIITDVLILANDKSIFIMKVPKEINNLDVEDIKLPDFEYRDSDKVVRFSTKYLVFNKNFQ